MPLPSPIVTQIVVAAASVLTGLTGFGFALVSVPVLLLFLPPANVIVIVLLVGELVDIVNAVTARRYIDRPLLGRLLPTATLGMVLGGFILSRMNAAVLKLGAAVLVVLFATLLLRRRARPARHPAWTLIAGAASGVLTTSTGLSGPPVVLLMQYALQDKHASRATLAAYFSIIGPLGLAVLFAQQAMPATVWGALWPLIPVALVGRTVGSALHRRTPQRLFRAISLGVTLLAGLGGVASAVTLLLAHT